MPLNITSNLILIHLILLFWYRYHEILLRLVFVGVSRKCICEAKIPKASRLHISKSPNLHWLLSQLLRRQLESWWRRKLSSHYRLLTLKLHGDLSSNKLFLILTLCIKKSLIWKWTDWWCHSKRWGIHHSILVLLCKWCNCQLICWELS